MEIEKELLEERIPKSLYDVVSDALVTHGDTTALVYDDVQFSYLNLISAADRWSHYIHTKFSNRPNNIAIKSEKKPELIALILACLKLDIRFTLLDTCWSDERVHHVMQSIGCNNIIEDLDNIMPVAYRNTYREEYEEKKNATYYVSTSGSSGVPKVILGGEKGLLNFAFFQKELFSLNSQTIACTFAPVYGDAFLKEVYTALVSGSCLCIPNSNESKTPIKFLQFIKRKKINFLQTTPSYFTSIINSMTDELNGVTSLKIICLAGESVEKRILAHAKDKLKNTELQIFSFYGPTETTITKSYIQIFDQGDANSKLSIGQSLPGSKIKVIDKQGNKVKPLQQGRIIITTSDATLGRMVKGKLEPFNWQIKEGHLVCQYDTGDIGRYTVSNEIIYIGREDSQVKVNGLRLNLENFNYIAKGIDGLKAVSSILHNEQIVVFYTSDLDLDQVLLNVFNKWFKGLYNGYFVQRVDEVPLKKNGKVDSKALGDILDEIRRKSQSVDSRESESPVYINIKEMWLDVLKTETIHDNSHFFKSGGHSLTLMSLIGKIEAVFNVDVSLKKAYQNLVFSDFVKYIEGLILSNDQSSKDRVRTAHTSRIPLLAIQKQFVLKSIIFPEDGSTNMVSLTRIKNSTEPEKLASRIVRLASSLPCLSLVFGEYDNKFYQSFSNVKPEVEINKYKGNLKELCLDLEEDAQVPLSLNSSVLYQFKLFLVEGKVYFYSKIYHGLCDGYGLNQIIAKIVCDSEIEEDIEVNRAYFLQEISRFVSRPLDEYTRSEWKRFYSGRYSIQAEPMFNERLPWEGGNVLVKLNQKSQEFVIQSRKKFGYSTFVILLACWNKFILQTFGNKDFLVGIDSKLPVKSNAIGPFINFMLIPHHKNDPDDFRSYIETIQNRLLVLFDKNQVDILDLQEIIEFEKKGLQGETFLTLFRMFTGLEGTTYSCEMGGAEDVYLNHKNSKFPLTVTLQEKEGEIFGEIEFSLRYWEKEFIETLWNSFNKFIEKLDMKSSKQKKVDLSRQVSDQFVRNSDRIALVGRSQITFEGYQRKVKKLRDLLLNILPDTSSEVVVYGGKSELSFVATLASLVSGRTTIPLDDRMNPKEIRSRLSGSNAKLILDTTEKLEVEGLEISVMKVNHALIDALPESEKTDLFSKNRSEIFATFFTSGSTGQFKACHSTYKLVSDFISWECEELKVCENDTFLNLTSLSFDAVLRDLFLPLYSGAKIVFPGESDLDSHESFFKLLNQHKVTKFQTVPTLLRFWIEDGVECNSTVDTIVLSGEKLTKKLCEKIFQVFKNNSLKIYNFYGATETVMIKTAKKITKNSLNKYSEDMPIGEGIDGAQVLFLEPGKGFVCKGESGEIGLFFEGIAELAELNKHFDCFQQIYFQDKIVQVYRTGDIGFLQSGELFIKGRIDDEVKIFGQRFSLKEVESVLDGFPGIEKSIVVLNAQSEKLPFLKAYLKLSQEGIDISKMNSLIQTQLASMKIPKEYFKVDRFPTLPSGKVDKKSLQDLETDVLSLAYEYTEVKENNEKDDDLLAIQKELVSIWSDALKKDTFSVRDNFFQIGGHSLLATKVLMKIRQSFGINIPLRVLFQNLTIDELSRAIKVEFEKSVERLSENELMKLLDED